MTFAFFLSRINPRQHVLKEDNPSSCRNIKGRMSRLGRRRQGSIKILVADDNQELCGQIAGAIAQEPDLELVGTANTGLEALECIRKHTPDLLLLDLIMPYLDGLGVLEQLREEARWQGRVIIMSALGAEEMIRLAFSLGASYYLIKPFEVSVLLDRARLIASQKPSQVQSKEPKEQILEQAISELLSKAGVPPHFKGYLYLRDCIGLVARDFDRLGSIMKTVYPIVAERYQSTPQKIERTIRHAIETTWDRGNMKLLNELFGTTIDAERGKATNTLFIAKLADEIRLKYLS